MWLVTSSPPRLNTACKRRRSTTSEQIPGISGWKWLHPISSRHAHHFWYVYFPSPCGIQLWDRICIPMFKVCLFYDLFWTLRRRVAEPGVLFVLVMSPVPHWGWLDGCAHDDAPSGVTESLICLLLGTLQAQQGSERGQLSKLWYSCKQGCTQAWYHVSRVHNGTSHAGLT